MKKRVVATGLLCCASLITLTGTLQAQDDHWIENQRYAVGIDDFAWGDTYVGERTSGNALIITNWIDGTTTNKIILTVDSLQVGSEANQSNMVYIGVGGELNINEALSILGPTNGNGLFIDDQGTLFMKSDFDAEMGGFTYTNGANLKVGGEISNLDDVKDGLNFTLTGTTASWNFGTNILTVGAMTDSNSATLADSAEIAIDNLSIGSSGTTNNSFLITDGARANIHSNITIQGSGSTLHVANDGWLEVDMDFDAGMTGFELQTGGGLEAHRMLTMDAITNGANVVLDGTNAVWDRTGLNIDIGSSTNHSDNTLTVQNGAHAYAGQLNLGSFSDGNILTITNKGTVQAGNIQIGETNTQNNAVRIADQGNLFLAGFGSYINANNSLTLTEGGKLTLMQDFGSALDWDSGASFYWGNGGILECYGAAPIFTGMEVNGEYVEYGTLFLQRGQILVLNGPSATWNAGAHNLHIGDLSHGNALILTNGATATVKSMTIGDFAEGGNDNFVLVTGAGSEIQTTDGIGLGAWHDLGIWHYDGGSNNTLSIENGGRLETSGDFHLGGTGNRLLIDGAASELSVAGDILFNGQDQYIGLSNGAVLTNEVLSISGDGAILNIADGSLLALENDLTLAGLNSVLSILSGGILTNGGDFTMTGDSSTLLVSGTDSLLSAAGDMAFSGSNTTLTVTNGAKLMAGGDLSLDAVMLDVDGAMAVQSGATLFNQGTSDIYLRHGASISASNYYQAAGAALSYDIGNAASNSLGKLVISNTAEFEAGAEIRIMNPADLHIDAWYTNTLVEAQTLIIGGQTNATSEALDMLVTNNSTLVNFKLYINDDQYIMAVLQRISLVQTADFTEGSLMWDIANEIDRLSLSGNSAAANQINILNTLSGSQQNQQLNQLYAYQLPTYVHNQGIFGGIDQVKARGSSFHGASLSNQPAGARGPASRAPNQQLQGWAKVYGSFGKRDENKSFNDGYDVQAFGTIIGFDQAFDQWMLGVAGGLAGSTLDGSNGDQSEATTGYGMLYASYGTEEWFGDFVASIGSSDIDNDSGTVFGVTSSTKATQTAFYIGGGREFNDPEGSDAVLRPILALQASHYDQDGYTERSSNAVAKDVAGYDRWSYQSIFGAELILPTTSAKVELETQLRAYWLHEFNSDEDRIRYTLVDSGLPGQFILRSPVQNTAQLGIGCVATLDNGLQLRADLDGQAGDDFLATTISGSLIYRF